MDRSEDLIGSLRRAFALRGTAVPEEEVVGVALDLLRKTGRSYLRWSRGKTPTFETDDLAVEMSIVLFGKEPHFESESHFVNWSWKVARNLHLSHVQHKLRRKRGGGAQHVPISAVDPQEPTSILDIDVASLTTLMDRMGQSEPELVRIVTLRLLFGFSAKETAAYLDISERTVRRRFRAALAWLRSRL